MFSKVTLDNNIPVLIEKANEVHSVCIGIWVKVGARNERISKNGIFHFLEHMFFKGTEKRSAEDLAMETDYLGCELNALTSSEYTLFYIKVLDEYIEKALELLADIFLNSTFPEEDIEKEKNIVIEEIKMVEDNPSDYVHELFGKNIFGNQGLGLPVLGTVDTIGTFTRDDLVDHVNNFYGTENIVISCSGNFKEETLVNYLNSTLGKLNRKSKMKNEVPPTFTSDTHIITKDLSESHVCIGLKGIPYKNKERYSMHLLNTILGAGFSSRLFQNIREKRGLVYSIYSYHSSYFDTGLWGVYAGTDKKHVSEVTNITVDEISNLSNTITEDELRRAKNQLKGNLILALESTSNKMTNIAKQEIYYGTYYAPLEIIKMVESVTLEEIKDLAGRLVSDKAFAFTVYGPSKEEDLRSSCTLLQ
jgi:predicted Zn-dependent peptidase